MKKKIYIYLWYSEFAKIKNICINQPTKNYSLDSFKAALKMCWKTKNKF